jgi:LacI family transcriptional regulator
MVRLKDIAVRAGVSVMTVSKALRDAPDISATTKARIRLLAQEMAYMPNTMAQSLRSRTTKLLGLVIPAVTNPIFARVVLGLDERAYELGYDLVMAQSLNLPEREEKVIRRMLSRRVDGMLVFPVYRLEPTALIYEELKTRNIPTVLLGHRAPFCAHFVSVETNDAVASYLMTQHLLQLGHRRIAFLAGPPVAPASQYRLEGYRRALREAQIEWDDRLVFNAGSTIEEGEKAAQQMLQESPQVTAVQAVNDLVAIGAANHFLQQGHRIPEDLSVVGYGNILASEYFRVPLTTVRQPKLRLGVAAIDALAKVIKGEPVESQLLEAELMLRQSSGPPPRPR